MEPVRVLSREIDVQRQFNQCVSTFAFISSQEEGEEEEVEVVSFGHHEVLFKKLEFVTKPVKL